MGIKNLKVLLQQYCKTSINCKMLIDYSGKVFAIDTSIFLYKFLYNNSDPLDGFMRQSLRLLKNGIVPLFVFDGKPPKEKSCVIKNRKDRRKYMENKKGLLETKIKEKEEENVNVKVLDNIQENINEDGNKSDNSSTSDEDIYANMSIKEMKSELAKIKRKIICITPEHISKTMQLFDLIGIPYIVSKGEAESVCAKLSILNIVDACVSEDTDILANGGKLFIRNFNPDRNLVDEYDLNSILTALNINYNQFMDICILCGCDYTSKIYGIGPITAYKMIKAHNDIETVLTKITNKKYKVPDNFNYIQARHLFNHSTDNEDFDKIKLYTKLGLPNIKELTKFLKKNSPKLKKRYYNEINKKLLNYVYNIKLDKGEDLDKFPPNLQIKKKKQKYITNFFI